MFTYSEPYYHRIDTTVPVGGAIVSKYLPGQGKMIECKINSVFSDVNSDCPVCETINDFENFNVIVESKGKIYDRCCYDIKIQNLASCSSGIVPIKLISNTTGEILIDNRGFEDENGKKVAETQFDLQSTGDFLLGELCVMESPEPTTFEIVVGSTVDWVFYGCDRKFKFVLNCEQDTTDANNCCDLFDVVSTYVPPSNPPISCSTKLDIYNTGDNNCISSILFDQYSNGKYIEIDCSIVEPIFASSGTHWLQTIYIPMALCMPGSTPMFSKDATLIFRGSDGEIICTKEVPIYYCCDVIVDPGPINPNYKLSNDNLKNLAINNEVQLEIVPNPNFGYAKLGIESKYATIGTIKILSLAGEIVKEFPRIPVKASRDEISLNLSDVSSGSYYLIFESEYGISSLNIIKLQ